MAVSAQYEHDRRVARAGRPAGGVRHRASRRRDVARGSARADRPPPPRAFRSRVSTRAIPASSSSTPRSRRTAFERNDVRLRRAVPRRRRVLRLPVPPENGGAAAASTAKAIDYTPRPRRVHDGEAEGPTPSAASAVTRRAVPTGPARRRRTASCGATATARVSCRISGTRAAPPRARSRRCAAREMSRELQAEAAAATEQAKTQGHKVRAALSTKASSFGRASSSLGRRSRCRCGRRGRSGSHDPPLRLEGTPGHVASHDRGIAAHPSGADLDRASNTRCATARSTRRSYGSGRNQYDLDDDGVTPGNRCRHADDGRRLSRAARGADHASAARSGFARCVRGRTAPDSTRSGARDVTCRRSSCEDPEARRPLRARSRARRAHRS